MTNLFGKEIQNHLVADEPRRQGRSNKKLRASVRFQGGVYIAAFVGRRERFFGETPESALKNLKAGGL